MPKTYPRPHPSELAQALDFIENPSGGNHADKASHYCMIWLAGEVRALQSEHNQIIEDCALVCELNDEVTHLRDGNRSLMRKSSTNINGYAYAKGIRQLKKPDAQWGNNVNKKD